MSQESNLPPPPHEGGGLDKRRAAAPENDDRKVQFSRRDLNSERLEALRVFLKQASADEIQSVRRIYGDVPAVLELIDAEIGRTPSRKTDREKES